MVKPKYILTAPEDMPVETLRNAAEAFAKFRRSQQPILASLGITITTIAGEKKIRPSWADRGHA